MRIDTQEVGREAIVFRDLHRIRKWCRMPYPGHPRGCPNADGCSLYRDDLRERIGGAKRIHLIWATFDLDQQEELMSRAHPDWTPRQCRNLLYWQKKVRADLKWMANSLWPDGQLIIGAEGGGVDFYLTMRRLGTPLDTMRDLHNVRVIGIVLEDGQVQRNLNDYEKGGIKK